MAIIYDVGVINIMNYVNSRPKYSPPVEIFFLMESI